MGEPTTTRYAFGTWIVENVFTCSRVTNVLYNVSAWIGLECGCSVEARTRLCVSGTIPVPHADTVWCVAADLCSQTAISGSGDGSLRLWDLETGFCLKQWRGHSSLVQCVSFWRA